VFHDSTCFLLALNIQGAALPAVGALHWLIEAVHDRDLSFVVLRSAEALRYGNTAVSRR
jgi:hypothetical protein